MPPVAVPETIEGTWEEISRQADKLNGHHLRVTILPGEERKVNESPQTPEEWTKAFEEWVASHHDITAVLLDDSREAIYGDGNRG